MQIIYKKKSCIISNISKDKLFVAKSISLICQAPYAFAAQLFLKNLYR